MDIEPPNCKSKPAKMKAATARGLLFADRGAKVVPRQQMEHPPLHTEADRDEKTMI